eukprot:ANDGO_02326.mRNA.1 hypothetical protein
MDQTASAKLQPQPPQSQSQAQSQPLQPPQPQQPQPSLQLSTATVGATLGPTVQPASQTATFTSDHVSSIFSSVHSSTRTAPSIGLGVKRLAESGPPSTLEGQVELLSQIVQYQSLKIRRLEHAVSRIEAVLPDWKRLGDLDTVRERVRMEEDELDVIHELVDLDARKKKESVRQTLIASLVGMSNNLPGSSIVNAFAEAVHSDKLAGFAQTAAHLANASADSTKKKQTLYQAFMSVEIPRIKNEHPDIPQKEAFKIAANNWAKHPDNPKSVSVTVAHGDLAGMPPPSYAPQPILISTAARNGISPESTDGASGLEAAETLTDDLDDDANGTGARPMITG